MKKLNKHTDFNNLLFELIRYDTLFEKSYKDECQVLFSSFQISSTDK